MLLDSEDSCDGFSTGRKVSEKQKVKVFKEELSTFFIWELKRMLLLLQVRESVLGLWSRHRLRLVFGV